MPLTIHDDPVPLSAWEDGSVRVGGTRLLFAVLVECFNHTDSIEGALRAFPDARPADLYGAVAYYLRHRDEVDAFMAARDAHAAALRVEAERNLPMAPVKRRLLSRRAEKHAAAGR